MKNEKTTNQNKEEIKKKEKEVKVYGFKCGELKIHCMYDCFGETPWLSTAK